MSTVQLFHPELNETLIDFYYTPMAIKPPVMVEGTFGIGKSQAIEKAARYLADKAGLTFSDSVSDVNDESKFLFLTFILSHYDGGELKGLPYPSEDRTCTKYLPMEALPTKGQGMIFLDEIKGTAPMLQKVAYQMLQEHRIGTQIIPTDFAIHGAGNKADDMANVFDLDMPLNNRAFHCELRVPEVHDIESGGRIIRGWANDFAIPNKLDTRVINYLMSHPQNIFTYKPDMENPDPAQGSPRMWEKVARVLENIAVADYDRVERYVGMGVGTGIGTEFTAWLKLAEKFDVEEIFKGQSFTRPQRVDQIYSLISAFVGYYLGQVKGGKTDRGKLAVRLLDLATTFAKEHTAVILNQVKTQDKEFFPNVKKTAPDKYKALADNLFHLLI
jgi:hypothetical protein